MRRPAKQQLWSHPRSARIDHVFRARLQRQYNLLPFLLVWQYHLRIYHPKGINSAVSTPRLNGEQFFAFPQTCRSTPPPQ